MALNFASLDGNASDTADDNIVTASVTLANNNIDILIVGVIQETGANPNVPAVSGWTEIGNVLFSDGASFNGRLIGYRRLGAGGTGTHDINTSGQTNHAWLYELIQSADNDISGTNGSGAITQFNTNNDNSGSSDAPATTLGDFADPEADQALIVAILCGSPTTAISPEPANDFTQRDTTSYSLRVSWGLNEDLTPSGSLAAARPWAILAIEVKRAAGGLNVALTEVTVPVSPQTLSPLQNVSVPVVSIPVSPQTLTPTFGGAVVSLDPAIMAVEPQGMTPMRIVPLPQVDIEVEAGGALSGTQGMPVVSLVVSPQALGSVVFATLPTLSIPVEPQTLTPVIGKIAQIPIVSLSVQPQAFGISGGGSSSGGIGATNLINLTDLTGLV